MYKPGDMFSFFSSVENAFNIFILVSRIDNNSMVWQILRFTKNGPAVYGQCGELWLARGAEPAYKLRKLN